MILRMIVNVFKEPLVCSCGHVAAVHQHYRPGSDCSQCACPILSRGRVPNGLCRSCGQPVDASAPNCPQHAGALR